MEATDRDHAVDAVVGDGQRQAAAANGAGRTAEQLRPVIHHRCRPARDVDAGIARASIEQLLAERTVAETDFHDATALPLRRPDISQQIRVQVQVGAIEPCERSRGRIADTESAGQRAATELVPELGVLTRVILNWRMHRLSNYSRSDCGCSLRRQTEP